MTWVYLLVLLWVIDVGVYLFLPVNARKASPWWARLLLGGGIVYAWKWRRGDYGGHDADNF